MTPTALTLVTLFALGGGTAPSTSQGKEGAAAPAKVRIGTYDNRAVAVAYAASKYNPVKEKMAAYQKAKTAGDAKTMKELETWGEQHQRLLHFQGFGHVLVGDLLEPVKDQVQALAKRRGLAVITMECDFVAGDVEVVDVTEDLVKLYEPSERTLKMALGVRTAPRVDLLKLADMPAKQ